MELFFKSFIVGVGVTVGVLTLVGIGTFTIAFFALSIDKFRHRRKQCPKA